MAASAAPDRPIGVFDSGMGGLTVLAALQAQLPFEPFIYLGDTARLPYGTKTAQSVVRYCLQAADALIDRGVKALVIACNTASAVALPALRERHAPLPVIGVVEPGAAAAIAASRNGRIAVIGTEATVRGGAYQRAIATLQPTAKVSARACQVFVALAEEGWSEGAVAQAAAQAYLAPLFAPEPAAPDTLVLGCTHFPLLYNVIRAVVGDAARIVDSAATTAAATHSMLRAQGLLRPRLEGALPAPLSLLVTDGVARFASIGGRFLGRPITPAEIELIDL
jgi:glutamate racemase